MKQTAIVTGGSRGIGLAIAKQLGLDGYQVVVFATKPLEACMEHLKELEEDQLIVRKEYPQIPPKVEYSLSERGRSLIPILISMCQWGSQHKSDYVQGKAKEYDNDNQTC